MENKRAVNARRRTAYAAKIALQHQQPSQQNQQPNTELSEPVSDQAVLTAMIGKEHQLHKERHYNTQKQLCKTALRNMYAQLRP